MNSDYKWYILQSKLKRKRAAEILAELEKINAEAVLIKGAAVERFYPENLPRPSVDIDIAVSPVRYEEVVKMFKAGEFGLQDVDLHNGLRHFDRRDWSDIYKKTKVVDIDGSTLRILSEEDQLRVTCIHWLTDGAERKERLEDILYLVKNRTEGFDWDYALNADGAVRRGWIVASIGLANRYLDLEIDSLPFADEARDLPQWLTNAVENRWKDDVKFVPLDAYFRDPVNFFRQLKRRFPPNPIMSTVMTEGPFDEANRLKYQVSYIFKRAIPSLSRSCKTIYNLVTGPK